MWLKFGDDVMKTVKVVLQKNFNNTFQSVEYMLHEMSLEEISMMLKIVIINASNTFVIPMYNFFKKRKTPPSKY